MTITRIGMSLVTGAALISPCLGSAQNYPAAGQPTQQQSMQQQQQPAVPGAGTSGEMQDSANTGTSSQAMKDKMFVRKAAEGGMAEVQLGQLASQKASSDDVKSFGQQMVKDHTQLNDEMKPIAESMGVMLPKKLSSKDQAEYDKLNGLSGSDFDKEYLTYMVKDHHADLREFRMEAANAADPTLKAAVEKGAKVIREHTSMVDSLARSKGIATPGRGDHKAPPAGQ